MNENNQVIVKQKSNKGIIIVLIILLMGALGYIAYDKFIVKDVKPETNEITESTTTKEETKNDNVTINTEELYKQYINNIKTRKDATPITITSNKSGDKANFILGSDNKLYLETYADKDTKIPGTMGSDGFNYNGQYIGIDGVVRIFETYHTPSEGGSYHGMLVLKEDGNLYILRNPVDKDYSLEKLDQKYIVDSYYAITAQGTTYVVDILGNQYAIK